MPTPIHRRTLLAAAPLLALPGSAPGWLGALRARAAALNGPGLLRSYDVAGTSAFDIAHANTAYVYDNAVAGLALLLSGDVAMARRLGDALATAQATDRFFHDGRVRNAYAAGPSPRTGTYPLPGWWDARQRHWLEDAYQAGSATGVVAWAMLLWVGLHRATGDTVYFNAANKAADWVERSTTATLGFSGGFFGFEPAQRKDIWVSTEHNTDLAAAFAGLGRVASAAHARDFVASMWVPAQGRFLTGLRPDGSRNDFSAVDANIWPSFLPDADPAWARALAWVLANHGLPGGVDFNTDRDGIWLEGTAMTALALKRANRQDAYVQCMATLRAQTAPSGLMYATTTPSLTTGLSTGVSLTTPDFLYYRRPHIAPTGWAVLAAGNVDPF